MHRLAAAFLLFAPFASLAAQTRNTLLVVADDVGVDAITCYGLGSNPPPTPNIDALAASGIRFSNAQACPLCSPTRASILTGRHSFRTGVGTALMGNQPGLAASEVLLPEILAPAGIANALIGKWHLGADLGPLTPTAEGFGTFTGGMGGTLPSYYSWPKVENGTTSTSTAYATTDTVDEALTWVGATAQPWFLMLSFHAGHSPYEAPPAGLHTQNLAGLNPATQPVPFFRAMVQAMDTELGRFLTTIPAAVRANTNIVFLGDNGTTSAVTLPPFDPARSKGSIYQGGIHVPLIVAGPAVGGAPRVEPALVHAVDLFATMAALQGVDARAAVPATVPLDAIDVAALLAGAGATPPRAFSYSQRFAGSQAMAANGDTEMIRNAQFELLRFRLAGTAVSEELYDLVADPWEDTDLLLSPLSAAASAAYTSLKRELAKLRGYAWSTTYGAGCTGGGANPALGVLADSAPSIGNTFTLRVTGLTAAVPAVVGALGFQNTTWLGVPLPVDLTVAGMTGCSLFVDPALTTVLVPVLLAATMPIALPNDPAIVGAQLYTQAFPLLLGANPAGILATNALEAVVGN
ncbi:MAG: sulfatase-like hydrolase/transferase [Planctomycetota bacterium]